MHVPPNDGGNTLPGTSPHLAHAEGEDAEQQPRNFEPLAEKPIEHPDSNDYPEEKMVNADAEEPEEPAVEEEVALDDEDEEDMEWDSDESDDEILELPDIPASQAPARQQQQQQRGKPQSGPQQQQQKRQSGHGSQRVKNKQKKSGVKHLWRQRDWGDKPAWLSWREALGWLKRGVQPPARRPSSTPTPADRARLASLLSAHQYIRDASGAIIPLRPGQASSTSQTPQASSRPQPSTEPQRDLQRDEQQDEPPPHPQEPGSKAEAQAHQDHHDRQAANPYRLPPEQRAQGQAVSSIVTMDQPAQPAQQARRQRPQEADQDKRGHAPNPGVQERRLSFSLPDDHREDPPKPTRTQPVLRKLTDSTIVQLTGDGVSNYPVRIVDNRPLYMQNPDSAYEGVEQGDALFSQPAHLTSATTPFSSASSITKIGGQPRNTTIDPLDTADLDIEANRAISHGQAPGWNINGHESTMRSSIRAGEISFDIAWTPGAAPPTIPPSIPLAPHNVLTLKGSAIGAWRGHVWTPTQGDVIRHPPRVVEAPTIVAYRPLNTPPKGPALASGVCITLRPVGSWISTTKFELTFARTPRFWLVQVESSPTAGQGEWPLSAGQTFFLEWMGSEREWVRRPRFSGDVKQLGGFSIVPPYPQPRPPTPPQRRNHTQAKTPDLKQGKTLPAQQRPALRHNQSTVLPLPPVNMEQEQQEAPVQYVHQSKLRPNPNHLHHNPRQARSRKLAGPAKTRLLQKPWMIEQRCCKCLGGKKS